MNFNLLICHCFALFASFGNIRSMPSDGLKLQARVTFVTPGDLEASTSAGPADEPISITYSEKNQTLSFKNAAGLGIDLSLVCIDLTRRENEEVSVTNLFDSTSYKLFFDSADDALNFENALMDPIFFGVSWCQERNADPAVELQWHALYIPKTQTFEFTPYGDGARGASISAAGETISIPRKSITNYSFSGTVSQVWVGQTLYTVNFKNSNELDNFKNIIEETTCVLPR